MVASVRQMRSDPFEDLTAETVRQVLVAKGWAGLSAGPSGLSLDLGELVIVVATGKEGAKSLARLAGAHGDLPPAPMFHDMPRTGDADLRVVRVFRRPGTESLPNAVNLHGAVAGVSVIAAGRESVPPTVKGGALLAWRHDAHPSSLRVPELPLWLVEMARDPAAAHRAWGSARPTPGAARILAEWERGLTMHRGRPAPTFANACTILRAAPAYSGRIVFNELVQGATLDGKPVTEGAIGRVREHCEREWGVAFGSELLRSAIQTVAEERSVHPVKEYLIGLKWDGVKRLDAVAGSILHAPEPLAAVMVKRFFVGAVARVMRPGCKLDTALVFEGAQGAQKSTFFQIVGGEWFTDTHVDLGSKDAYLQLAGAWIVEWGEIERVTGRRGADEIKSFLSSRSDRFRPPYGRAIVEVLRSCVLVGSTNQATFLDDDTGSRRFWVVRVRGFVDIVTLKAWRDQLWAEARELFEAGEPWWLDESTERDRAEDAEQHAVEDGWTAAVLRYVARESLREDFTASEVLKGALDVPLKDHDRTSVARVGRILRAVGWERRKHRPYRDGTKGDPVWCWFRPTDPNAPALPAQPYTDGGLDAP